MLTAGIQNIIALALVAAAAVWLIRQVVRKKQAGGCGCGCDGCAVTKTGEQKPQLSNDATFIPLDTLDVEK